ncbi:MAG: ACP S-malonyltransferase [Oscillatoriales cyanobacterium RM2_1_1]|nr:ACP S-malonyltransferase [Oscillatoriales cyanobacterium SM2_3_0]NJO47152.1 ACP S-malonyltransferase [Oscillatoriales cyanobacterium RM2_1_1]
MTKTAWLFPGQGSQTQGMGADLVNWPLARSRFEQAEQILGWSVLEICQGEEAQLAQTRYTQPCLYVIESLLAEALLLQGQAPTVVAGHSLGEYVALYVAGVFDFETGLTLVKQRAELMAQVAGGMMAALIGFDRGELETQLQQTQGVVLANDNSSAQVVISGTPEAVEKIMASVKTKRGIKLNVSGAFHSPMMAIAATEFEQVLSTVPFAAARFPVLSNVEPMATTDPEILKHRLSQQMTGTVRWRETCLTLSEFDIEKVIEIGPGKVLTGLVKRICPDLALENIAEYAQVMD